MLKPICSVLLLAGVATALQGGPPGGGGGPGFPPPGEPPGNAITVDKALLGKALFWDEQLSSTGTVACGTCHAPGAGGSDPRSIGGETVHPGADGLFGTGDDVVGSAGVPRSDAFGFYHPDPIFGFAEQVTGRKAPSVINAVYSPTLFWDGRATNDFVDPVTGMQVLPFAASLESQAVGPILNDGEMAHEGMDWPDVIARLESVTPLALASDIPADVAAFASGLSYAVLFERAFGTPEVTVPRIAMAIATYERTLISNVSPFDDFLMGVPGALNPQEAHGQQVFNTNGRCMICHGGPLTSHHTFHNTGVSPINDDPGLGGITGMPQDMGRFKTPGVRNGELHPPFFHDGSQDSIEGVVDFYIRGGDFHINQDPDIIPLNLNNLERNALIAFLKRPLTDPRVRDALPPFDHPVLFSQSDRRAEVFGEGGPGSGGFIPAPLVLEPALIGNPSMTMGLAQGMGGAPVLIGLDVASSPPGTMVKGVPFHLGFTPAMFIYPFPPGLLSGSGPGNGFATVPAPVPDDPTIVGLEVVLQWFVVDPGAAGGIASTPGVRLTFFAPSI